MAKKSSLTTGQKAARTRKRRAAAKKAVTTKKRRKAGKTAAQTRKWNRVHEAIAAAIAALDSGELAVVRAQLEVIRIAVPRGIR